MTGWNLPPGCNVSDIPGNRPEDQKAEAIGDAIYTILEGLKLPDSDVKDDTVEKLIELVLSSYSEGYSEALYDAAKPDEITEEREEQS